VKVAKIAENGSRQLALWLLALAAMVFVMAIVGAITRLTESGLSIVEWRPYIGALPPLSDAEWHRVFDLYRQTPQFRLENSGMDLSGFKSIYYWEWFHRLWGQIISLVLIGPMIWFWQRGYITPALRPRMWALLGLGALQALVGMVMVASGMRDEPAVSHYWLAAHLFAALAIYIFLIWTALGLLNPRPDSACAAAARWLRPHAALALGMVLLTMCWGAFTAGLRAGTVYNTFPLMNGHWVPPEIDTLVPLWLNPLRNTAAVQFIHRWLAIGTGLVVLALSARASWATLPASGHRLALAIGVMVLAQIGLGVATLLHHVPVALGAAHQGGALVLVGLLVWFNYEVRGMNGGNFQVSQHTNA